MIRVYRGRQVRVVASGSVNSLVRVEMLPVGAAFVSGIILVPNCELS